jgi:hypothetical protein
MAAPGSRADNRAGPTSGPTLPIVAVALRRQSKMPLAKISGASRAGSAPAAAMRAAVACAGLVQALPLAGQAVAADLAAPVELVRRINADAACTRLRVVGLCFCGAVPCGYRVSMDVPVAFAETVRAPGDSLLGSLPWRSAAAISGAAGTASSRQSGLDNTAEVHAWLLRDWAWTLVARPPCLTCRPSDAQSPLPAPSAPPGAPVPGCGPAEALAAQASLGSLLPSWSPVLSALVYASEFDALNWRTGCRDLARPVVPGVAGADVLGQWGPLYPRQMRDLGTSAVVYSAKTAYRALSIARDQLASFQAPVDLAARMQQAYPAVSACFAVGTQPLPDAAHSAQPVQAATDGRYGWFYWRPVTCCVDFSSLAQCAR